MVKFFNNYSTPCRVSTILLLIAAVVFSALTLTSCDFAKRGTDTFGLFSYGAETGCLNSYSNFPTEFPYPHGWLHTWAAICGAIAPIFGAINVLFMLMDCCCKVCCGTLIQNVLFAGAELSQACTFLMYTSDACVYETDEKRAELEYLFWGGCEMGQGTVYSFIAFGCFIAGSCFHCLGPKYDPLCCKNDGDAAEKDPEEGEGGSVQDEDAATYTQSSPGQSSPGQSSPGQSSPGQCSPGQSSPGLTTPQVY